MGPVSTLIFAAHRCLELTHLADVVRKFSRMFGARFVLAAADLRDLHVDSHVDRKVGHPSLGGVAREGVGASKSCSRTVFIGRL